MQRAFSHLFNPRVDCARWKHELHACSNELHVYAESCDLRLVKLTETLRASSAVSQRAIVSSRNRPRFIHLHLLGPQLHRTTPQRCTRAIQNHAETKTFLDVVQHNFPRGTRQPALIQDWPASLNAQRSTLPGESPKYITAECPCMVEPLHHGTLWRSPLLRR